MTEGAHIAGEGSSNPPGNRAPGNWPFVGALSACAILMGALVVAPFFVSLTRTRPGGVASFRLLSTHDLNEHLIVMDQFDKTLRSGVLYPRWLAGINGDYGNAWTNFYPPALYYVTSAIHAVVGDWLAAVAALCVISMAGSGVSLYVLARAFFGRGASMIAASFYMLLPYHVLDLFWRGALPELLGFVFLPLLIYFAFRLGNNGKLVDYAGLGLTYGLYVMTHIPVAYLMTYVLAIYAITWSFREKDRRVLLRIGGGMVLGLMVCAIYLLPAALESRYAYESTSGIFPYNGSYLPALPPSDNFGDTLNHTFMLQAIALAVVLIVLRSTRRKKARPATASESHLQLWTALGIWTTLMCTPLSFYLSAVMPRTDLVAFPWRWLTVAGMFTSLLLAAAIDSVSGNTVLPKRQLVFLSAIMLVAFVNVWFTVQRVIGGTLANASDFASRPLVEENYTPRGATSPQQLPNTARVETEPPEGAAVEVTRWDPQRREIYVRAEQSTVVRLKTYNFPGWTARVDGSRVSWLSDREGVQRLEVSPGIHRIAVSFENTPPRTAGTIMSGLALVAILGLILFHRVRRRGHQVSVAYQGKAEPYSEPSNSS
ncbi:MAG TPA: 6-pyruvoyl-tetrahydropterin synthase-related protein [Blastocatellia bacterium]|nr:6-pyruvoyl-tetrahydropterin synthase-related protein [Blastocatellia bacterium]